VPPATDLDYSTFIEAVLPEDREYVDRSWREALKGAPYDIEHRILVGDTVKWVRERAEVEFDGNGRAVRGTGIVQDITPRKSAEEAAARLQAELDHVTRVATLSEFSSALAHELNQPLAAILANAQAALRFLDVDPPDLAELREILEDVVRDDQRARDVILKLREMFRKSAGRRAFARLEVNPLVDDVLRIAKGDLAMRRVTLETDLAGELPTVTGDAVQLRQVLLNLVLNALEAMEETPAPRLTIRTRDGADGAVDIEVVDTGPGIAPGEESRLFQPFFTTKEHGMGMGLAVSRAIVEAHGGRIGAESNGDAAGVRFVISLPANGGER
jgi:C4-dicarboxylate-specific signal transduction histidine kinase